MQSCATRNLPTFIGGGREGLGVGRPPPLLLYPPIKAFFTIHYIAKNSGMLMALVAKTKRELTKSSLRHLVSYLGQSPDGTWCTKTSAVHQGYSLSLESGLVHFVSLFQEGTYIMCVLACSFPPT